MKRTGRKKEWAILVFCVFLLGISPPIILVFDSPVLVFNYPLSFLYLYSFWALMILFIAIGSRKGKQQVPPDRPLPSIQRTGAHKNDIGDYDAR